MRGGPSLRLRGTRCSADPDPPQLERERREILDPREEIRFVPGGHASTPPRGSRSESHGVSAGPARPVTGCSRRPPSQDGRGTGCGRRAGLVEAQAPGPGRSDPRFDGDVRAHRHHCPGEDSGVDRSLEPEHVVHRIGKADLQPVATESTFGGRPHRRARESDPAGGHRFQSEPHPLGRGPPRAASHSAMAAWSPLRSQISWKVATWRGAARPSSRRARRRSVRRRPHRCSARNIPKRSTTGEARGVLGRLTRRSRADLSHTRTASMLVSRHAPVRRTEELDRLRSFCSNTCSNPW